MKLFKQLQTEIGIVLNNLNPTPFHYLGTFPESELDSDDRQELESNWENWGGTLHERKINSTTFSLDIVEEKN